MAEVMIRSRRLLGAAVLLLAQASVHAQSMQDPTRPPALSANGEHSAGAGSQLQSVLISRQPGGRHVAVIDGDTVRLGDSYRGARVARIAPHRVELLRGRERQVLTLPANEEAGSVNPVARPR
jgi:MSHA biogenesis protein MshK